MGKKKTKKKISFKDKIRAKCLSRLESKLYWEEKKARLKAKMHKVSHSLLWIWEFSKKAVMVCFGLCIITWIFAMAVMVIFQDFSYLNELIIGAKEILRDCVFAYFIKAGIENVVKIVCSTPKRSNSNTDNEPKG